MSGNFGKGESNFLEKYSENSDSSNERELENKNFLTIPAFKVKIRAESADFPDEQSDNKSTDRISLDSIVRVT